MSDLWTRGMTDAEQVAKGKSEAERIHIMCEAIDYAMFRSLTPLAAIPAPGARALIEEALTAGRAGAPPQSAFEISGRIYPHLDTEGTVGSIMLDAALVMLSGLSEGARPGDVSNVLFQCYDATLQRQGIGRRITIDDERGSPACVDLIREQRKLLDAA
ncbi:hypothetical protein ACGFJ7_38080 [Actinoplanes sp. NPDC048988]|uniref:hypothetical protein n=1 Tax=Actinoplanes sp. NPDC048988 TaxID=3363901 RepID=UPI0037198865